MNEGQALREARQLLQQHGLFVQGWTAKLDKGVRRRGVCNYNNKSIGLSRQFVSLNDWETVRNTILHEIAHALVGPTHKHNSVWRNKCIEIGGTGETYSTGGEMMLYVGRCNKCNKQVGRFAREPRKVYLHSADNGTLTWNREIITV